MAQADVVDGEPPATVPVEQRHAARARHLDPCGAGRGGGGHATAAQSYLRAADLGPAAVGGRGMHVDPPRRAVGPVGGSGRLQQGDELVLDREVAGPGELGAADLEVLRPGGCGLGPCGEHQLDQPGQPEPDGTGGIGRHQARGPRVRQPPDVPTADRKLQVLSGQCPGATCRGPRCAGAVPGGTLLGGTVPGRPVPVALPLPGRAGQVQDPPPDPRYAVSVGAQGGQRGVEGVRVFPAQGPRDQGIRGTRVGQGPGERRHRHRVRGDLQEGPVPLGGGSADGIGEADRPAQVRRPVVGVQRAWLRVHGGVEGHRRRCRTQPGQTGAQGRQQRVHRGGVSRSLGREQAGRAPGRRHPRAQRADRLRCPGDHELVRRGDDREPHRVQPRGDVREVLLGQLQHRHRPGADGGQESRPQRDQPEAVDGLQRPRDHGCGHLSQRLPDHAARPQSVGPPHLGKGHLEAEDQRLSVVDPVHRSVAQSFPQAAADVPGERRFQRVHGGGEGRFPFQQRPPHPGPLAAVPGEHPDRRPRRPLTGTRGNPGSGPSGRHRTQPLPQRPGSPGDHDGPRVSPFPAPPQGGRDVLVAGRRVGRRPPGELTRLRPDPTRIPVGEDADGGPRTRVDRGPLRRRSHGLLGGPVGLGGGAGERLQDQVGVRPAEAEGRHPRPNGPIGGQRDRDVGHPQPGLRPRHERIGPVMVDRRRDQAMVQGEHRGDEPGDPGGGLQVTQVRLHRPDQQGPPVATARAAHGGQGARLDRVSQRGSRPVRLDVVDRPGVASGGGVGLAQQCLLGARVRGHQPGGASVGVHRPAQDDRQHPVAVAQGVVQPLQDADPAPLGTHDPVGVGGERPAPAGRGEPTTLAEGDAHGRAEQDVHPGGEGQVGAPGGQVADRLVHRDQRGGAGGVDGEARATQVQQVRQPVRGHAQGCAGGGPRLHPVQVGAGEVGVLRGADADVDAGAAAAQRSRIDGGMGEGLVGDLQHQALLGVHQTGLARGDPEEVGIEPGHVVQEAAPAGGTVEHGLRR